MAEPEWAPGFYGTCACCERTIYEYGGSDGLEEFCKECWDRYTWGQEHRIMADQAEKAANDSETRDEEEGVR